MHAQVQLPLFKPSDVVLIPTRLEHSINDFTVGLNQRLRFLYLSTEAPRLDNKEQLKQMLLKECMDVVEEMARDKHHATKVEMKDMIEKVSYALCVLMTLDPLFPLRKV